MIELRRSIGASPALGRTTEVLDVVGGLVAEARGQSVRFPADAVPTTAPDYYLPAEGRDVQPDDYWTRRVRDGDVTVGPQTTDNAATEAA